MRIPALVFFAALSFALPSCTVGKYLQNRGCDLLDCFDFKAGYGGLGLGAKVQASEYVKTGVGYGDGYRVVEFYGRHKDQYPMPFIHYLAAGHDGPGDNDLLLLGSPPEAVEPLDRARFGGEIVLPGVNFGFFLNLGQLADFLAGFAGIDLAGDDSLPVGTPLRGEWIEEKEPTAPSPSKSP